MSSHTADTKSPPPQPIRFRASVTTTTHRTENRLYMWKRRQRRHVPISLYSPLIDYFPLVKIVEFTVMKDPSGVHGGDAFEFKNPLAAAIVALDMCRGPTALWLKAEALRSESERWDTMLALIRLSVAPVEPPDAEVLAEALAAFKRVETLPAPEAVVAGAMRDPRFSPKEGRPDPAVLLARLEKAVDALRRAR